MSLSQAGHHVKELREAGCIEFVKQEPRGGAVEHFYRAVKRPELSDEEWELLPDRSRRQIVAAVFRNLIAEGLSAIRSGKMSADRHLWLSWKSMSFDAQGRKEAADERRESFERLQQIEADSNKRMNESGEKGVSTIISVLGFTRSRNVPVCLDRRSLSAQRLRFDAAPAVWNRPPLQRNRGICLLSVPAPAKRANGR